MIKPLIIKGCFCILACLLLQGALAQPVFAGTDKKPRIAVLYPTSSERVSALYQSIIKSMGQARDVDIDAHELSADTSADDIEHWLTQQKSQAVILLGKKGLAFSIKLTLNIPVVTGAHTGIQSTHSAVSLTADPLQLFAKLKSLQPGIQQVNVIYSEASSGWLIKKARLAAAKNKIKLNAIKADSMQAAGLELKNLLPKLNPMRDAVWLPYDPILPVKPLLPDLLKKSWQKNLIIFSGNPYHVQQGVLFALFPDYSKLGKQLIDLTLKKLHKNSPINFEASRYLNSAINIRTASHLGIQLSGIQKDKYKMVFPKK